jgi:transposase-like protein
MLNAGMDDHLGTEAEEEAGNHRNCYSDKTVLTDMMTAGTVVLFFR